MKAFIEALGFRPLTVAAAGSAFFAAVVAVDGVLLAVSPALAALGYAAWIAAGGFALWRLLRRAGFDVCGGCGRPQLDALAEQATVRDGAGFCHEWRCRHCHVPYRRLPLLGVD